MMDSLAKDSISLSFQIEKRSHYDRTDCWLSSSFPGYHDSASTFSENQFKEGQDRAVFGLKVYMDRTLSRFPTLHLCKEKEIQ